MGKLLDIITAPAGTLVGTVASIIDGLHTSEEEKLEAQRKILQAQHTFHLELMKADHAWAETQASVIREEVSSKSWLAVNWRPLLMLVFTYIILHNFVIAPLFSVPQTNVPPDMWELLKLGMGGYIIGRSAEKIVPTVLNTRKG